MLWWCKDGPAKVRQHLPGLTTTYIPWRGYAMAVSELTCSAPGCVKPVRARNLCGTHYARLSKTGSIYRPCEKCGDEISGQNGGQPICRSCAAKGCSICGKPLASKGFCENHYRRWKSTGDPIRRCAVCGGENEGNDSKYCSKQCRPVCKVDECTREVSSNGYCNSHSSMVSRNGKPYGAYRCVPKSDSYTCLVCGAIFPPNGRSRKACSPRCRRALDRNGAGIPSLSFECRLCGKLVERDWRDTVHAKPDKARCSDCDRRPNNRGWYAAFYRHVGEDRSCKICGDTVDFNIKWPHPLSKSVDHVIPLSMGGGSDLENLQLAHLRCNMRKQARLDYIPENSI